MIECDVFINVPVLKHHGGAGITMGMKNLMGTVWNRGEFSLEGASPGIADCSLFRKPALTVIDAYRMMTRNGRGVRPRGMSPCSRPRYCPPNGHRGRGCGGGEDLRRRSEERVLHPERRRDGDRTMDLETLGWSGLPSERPLPGKRGGRGACDFCLPSPWRYCFSPGFFSGRARRLLCCCRCRQFPPFSGGGGARQFWPWVPYSPGGHTAPFSAPWVPSRRRYGGPAGGAFRDTFPDPRHGTGFSLSFWRRALPGWRPFRPSWTPTPPSGGGHPASPPLPGRRD